MRRRAPQFFAAIAAVVLVPSIVWAQATWLPTPAPAVTAENEGWYQSGDPVMFAGNIYFPTGPLIHFDANQMVRSGDFRGIPLYSLTTIEPYSKVYVPLASGLMKPYERRRAGDIAGTAGSSTPSFPVVNPHDPREEAAVYGSLIQAAAPPMLSESLYGTRPPEPVGPGGLVEPAPIATTGATPYPLGPLASARKPEGLDGIYIDYRDRRWMLSGAAVELDTTLFTAIGEYRGFPVYRKGDDERTIYVTVARNARELLAPYSAGGR
jgi:hypothetical protein